MLVGSCEELETQSWIYKSTFIDHGVGDISHDEKKDRDRETGEPCTRESNR
jgi:hypothetical protein